MKIATIGLSRDSTEETQVQSTNFMEAASLNDVDTVIWNVEALTKELEPEIEQQEPKILSVKGSETLLAMSRHWRQEFKRLLAKGGTIVAFLPPPTEIGIHTLEEVMNYNLLEALHTTDIEPTAGPINELICQVGEPFRTLFSEISALLQPSGTLAKYRGTAILHTAQGEALASFYAQIPGRIILLPSLNEKAWKQLELRSQFYEAINYCVMRFGQNTGISNARWINKYVLAGETELLAEHSDKVRQLGLLQQRIQEIEETVSYYDFFKQIVAGVGPGSYIAVAQAFRNKGAFVQSDWVHSDLVLVERANAYLAIQIRLTPEEDTAAYLERLQASQQRISTYFGKKVSLLIVDSTQNATPINQRTVDSSLQTKAQKHDYLYIDSAVLYGWYLDQNATDIEALLQAIQNVDSSYLEALRDKVSQALQFTEAPSTSYLPTGTAEHLPQSDIFER